MLKLDSVGDNPFEMFGEWYKDAQESELNDPNAMCIATVDKDGYPDARIVLLKEWDEGGFVFYTNFNSRKGQQLLANMKATACFHWKSLRRQIRITGDVEQVSDEQADAYYNSRPKTSRLGAWASLQSSPLDQRKTLEQRVTELEEKYKHTEFIPRPPHWSGFRIVPKRMEFWTEWEFRLHDRFEYIRDADDKWVSQRLYP